MRTRTSGPAGSLLLVEESPVLPLVDLYILLRSGTMLDLDAQLGLTRLTSRVRRMGWRGTHHHEVADRFAALGGRISAEVGPSYVSLSGTVLARNVEPFFELVAKLLLRPAFRRADLELAVEETEDAFDAARENDRGIAARHSRVMTFGGHAYGRRVSGTRETIRSLSTTDLRAQHDREVVGSNAIFGIAGAVSTTEAQRLVDKHFASLPVGTKPKTTVRDARKPKGRRLRIIDKPGRTQAQLHVSTLGARYSDSDYFPLIVGDAIFGSMFSSRLSSEVRTKRGLSYGVGSSLGHDRARDMWSMWAHPATEDAAECLSLCLSLFDRWVDKGVTAAELSFAKAALTEGQCFSVDTPAKRLELALDGELFGLSEAQTWGFGRHIKRVKRAEVNRAIEQRFDPDALSVVVVGEAKKIRASLERAVPRLSKVEVVPFDVEV